MRARNFVFTVNFPINLIPYDLVPEVFPEWVSYMCWQFEIGEQGTLHLQGYLECVGKRSFKQILAIPGLDTQGEGYSVHIEVRRGTQAQAIAYCCKVDETTVSGTFQCHGEKKVQGHRSDLDDIKFKIDSGTSLKRIADEHFGSFIRYHRSFKEYKRIATPSRNIRTLVLVLWGASGVGKSQLALECFPDAYWKTNSKWWDDYENQAAVVWDEFKGQYPFRDLLRILDSTPLTLESKGSSCQFNSKIVIFTSNFHPRDWYSCENIGFTWERSPLRRRLAEFGQIVCMDPRPVLGVVLDQNAVNAPFRILGNSNNYLPI